MILWDFTLVKPCRKKVIQFYKCFFDRLITKSIVSCKSHTIIGSILRICSTVFISENKLTQKETVLFWSSMYLSEFSLTRKEFKFSASPPYLSQNACTRKIWLIQLLELCSLAPTSAIAVSVRKSLNNSFRSLAWLSKSSVSVFFLMKWTRSNTKILQKISRQYPLLIRVVCAKTEY